MKFIKKCPLFVLLLSTGLLFTIIALGGKNNIYAGQEYEPLTTPLLSVMFTAANDDIYPWQLFGSQSVSNMETAAGPGEEAFEEAESGEENQPGNNREESDKENQPGNNGEESGKENQPGDNGEESGKEGQAGNSGEKSGENTQTGENTDAGMEEKAGEGDKAGTAPQKAPDEGEKDAGNVQMADARTQEAGAVGADALRSASEALKEEAGFERLQPLRESTHEEYINHVSADIYGDAGVIRAASYDFVTVDESYFDDALFIGDSRIVGLQEYTDLSEHADFFCETSLTIYKALEEKFSGIGTVPEALANKDYGKIYIMLGINELGRGTTEDFMAKYTEVVDTLRELEPEAVIFIQGIMRVSGEKSSTDAIFTNDNINARNNAIATLADNKHIFYIDVNEVVCDEEGNLNEEYTFDQIHLLGACNDLVKQFLMEHGVAE